MRGKDLVDGLVPTCLQFLLQWPDRKVSAGRLVQPAAEYRQLGVGVPCPGERGLWQARGQGGAEHDPALRIGFDGLAGHVAEP